jgi:hypothetical protein
VRDHPANRYVRRHLGLRPPILDSGIPQAFLVRWPQLHTVPRGAMHERGRARARHTTTRRLSDSLSELQAVAVTAATIAVTLRSIEHGEPPDQLHANLMWALDLVKPVMDSRRQPPGRHT